MHFHAFSTPRKAVVLCPRPPRSQKLAGDGAGALPAVYPATMNYTLELLEEQGGALKYLESIGFGPADVRRLRERLLEDPTAGRVARIDLVGPGMRVVRVP